MYPTLADQAAVLFYEGCKMHAFVNGNKRLAILLLSAYLGHNGWQLDTTNEELVAVADRAAASGASERPVCIGELANWIGGRLQWLRNP